MNFFIIYNEDDAGILGKAFSVLLGAGFIDDVKWNEKHDPFDEEANEQAKLKSNRDVYFYALYIYPDKTLQYHNALYRDNPIELTKHNFNQTLQIIISNYSGT